MHGSEPRQRRPGQPQASVQSIRFPNKEMENKLYACEKNSMLKYTSSILFYVSEYLKYNWGTYDEYVPVCYWVCIFFSHGYVNLKEKPDMNAKRNICTNTGGFPASICSIHDCAETQSVPNLCFKKNTAGDFAKTELKSKVYLFDKREVSHK